MAGAFGVGDGVGDGGGRGFTLFGHDGVVDIDGWDGVVDIDGWDGVARCTRIEDDNLFILPEWWTNSKPV